VRCATSPSSSPTARRGRLRSSVRASPPSCACSSTRPDRPRKRLPEPVVKADRQRRTLLQEGVEGVRESLSQRNESWREKKPARLVLSNYAAGVGVGSGASGLSHLAMRRTKISGGKKAAIASVAGVTAGALSLPLQSSLTRKLSRGRYEVTPTGVRRRKAVPARPSTKAGTGGNLAKRETSDPGASLSRTQRRLQVTAAGQVPVLGNAAASAAAARLSPAPYRRRTAAQQFAGSQGGDTGGAVAGGAGALALAHRYKGFDRAAQHASDKVTSAKDVVRRAVGMKPASKGPGKLTTALTEHPKVPKLVRTAAKQVARRPGVAAVGALAGGMLGGQLGQQGTYSAIMRRDDRYRNRAHNSNPSARRGTGKISKLEGKPLSQREKTQLAQRKRRNAAMMSFTGTTGLGALGATIGEKALRHRKPGIALHLKRVTVPLLTAGAGVGGLNAYTGAKIQRREAATLSKRAPGNKLGWILLSPKTTAPASSVKNIAARQARGRTLAENRYHHEGLKKTVHLYPTGRRKVAEEWWTAPEQRLSKAFGVPRPPTGAAFPTGVRRAKTMRRGFLRQTRTSTGAVLTSSVRGGLG
jgi:hypothetical protein